MEPPCAAPVENERDRVPIGRCQPPDNPGPRRSASCHRSGEVGRLFGPEGRRIISRSGPLSGEVVYRLSDWPLRSMLMRRSRSAAAAARARGVASWRRSTVVAARFSSVLFTRGVDEFAELASTSDCAGRVGLPTQRCGHRVDRRPVLAIEVGTVLVGIESLVVRCGCGWLPVREWRRRRAGGCWCGR